MQISVSFGAVGLLPKYAKYYHLVTFNNYAQYVSFNTLYYSILIHNTVLRYGTKCVIIISSNSQPDITAAIVAVFGHKF